MNLTLTWSSSLVASLAAHAGVAALVLAMLDARPLADPPTPRSELRIETQEVAHSNAAAAKADAPQASLASAKGAAVAEGPVPQSRATASPPKQDRLTAAMPPPPQPRPPPPRPSA